MSHDILGTKGRVQQTKKLFKNVDQGNTRGVQLQYVVVPNSMSVAVGNHIRWSTYQGGKGDRKN